MAENRFAKYKAAPSAAGNRFAKYATPPVAEQLPVNENTPWTVIGQRALENTPSSAYQFGSDIVQAVAHPLQTLQAVGDLGAGALREGARTVLPASVFDTLDSLGNQEAANRASNTASAVGNFYKDRYGSMAGFKKALAEDPVGVLGDVSTVLMGGSTAAAKVPVVGANAAKALQTLSRVVNPITPVSLAGRYVGKVGGAIAKPLLGAATGTGSDVVGEAYNAGKIGGQYNKAFKRNLRGYEDQAAVVDDAKAAVGNIADQRRAEYQANMRKIGAANAPINMGPIQQKLSSLIDESFMNGHQIASKETIAKLQDMADLVDEWSSDPSMHNAIGADALKKRIDDLMPSFTEAGNAERVVSAMYDEIKAAIVQQVPEYADAMRAYEASKSVQRELEQTLKLGRKNSADQALRALQSVTRNNVNTNYAARAKQAEMLKNAGATELMPKLAGQALSAKMPRGLMQAVAGGAGAAAFFNPALWPVVVPGLIASSPRLVGEGANVLGRLARRTKPAREAAPEAALLLNLLGNIEQTGQPLLGQ